MTSRPPLPPQPPPPRVATTTTTNRTPWACILSVAMLLTIVELVAMYLLSPRDSSSAVAAVIPFVPSSIAASVEKPPPPPLPSEEFSPRALRERLLLGDDEGAGGTGRRRRRDAGASSSSSGWWVRVDVSEADMDDASTPEAIPSSRRSSDVAVHRVYDSTIDRCFGDDDDDGKPAGGGNSTQEEASSSSPGREGGGGGPGNPIPVPPATANSGGSGGSGSSEEDEEAGSSASALSSSGVNNVLPPLLDGDKPSYYGVGRGTCPSDSAKSTMAAHHLPSPSIEREYMIATGGFTDDDWSTFPVWAFDMTAASSLSSSDGNDGDGEIAKQEGEGRGGPWTDLSGKGVGAASSSVFDVDGDDETSSGHPWPRGRVGHVSAVHDGVLHVFGGLVWRGKAFRTEELCPAPPAVVIGQRGNDTGSGGADDAVNGTTTTAGQVPCVWRARIDDRLPIPRAKEREGDGGDGDIPGGDVAEAEIESSNATTTKPAPREPQPPTSSTPLRWERVSPKIVTYYERPQRQRERQRDVRQKHRQEQEGDKVIDLDRHQEREPPRIVDVEYAERYDELPNEPDIVEARKRLSRGEARGGYWESRSSLVFYGGLHPAPIDPENEEEDDIIMDDDAPLGDVWRYDVVSETFVQLSPYPPPPSQRDPRTGRHPRPRTAHAATVVGDVLLIYGGMALSSAQDARGPHPHSYSNYGAAAGGSAQNWDALTDLWAFDLIKERWIQRDAVPYLARSYHSLTGWGDGSVAAYGGFRTARTVGGEPIAFVFSDTLVNRPSDPRWYKAAYPATDGAGGGANYYLSEEAHGPSNRLEHAATTTKDGSMLVWGGRFKTVSQLFGVWSLRAFGPTADASTASFEPATPDGLEAYEAELEALHLLVAVMLFMTVLFTALYGTLRRQAEELNQAQANGGGVGMAGVVGVHGGNTARGFLGRRRAGLSREAIDALPVKRYGRTVEGADPSGAEAADPSLGGPRRDDDGAPPTELVEGAEAEEEHEVGIDEEEEDCCPICLVEYEEGEEVRTLPCGHEFHVGCIDPWLEGRTSCPACRASLSSCSAPREASRRGSGSGSGSGGEEGEEGGPENPREGASVDLSAILPSLAIPYAFGGGQRRRWFLPIDELEDHDHDDDGGGVDRGPSPRDAATTSPRGRRGPRRFFFRSIGRDEMDEPDDREAWESPRRTRRSRRAGLPPPQSRRRGLGGRRSTRRHRSGMEMVTLNLSALEDAEEVPELI